MGVLSDLVLADRKDAQLIGDSGNPVAEFGGLEAKGIDGVLLGELYCILEGSPSTVDFVVGFIGEVLYQASDEGPWVEEVPGALIEWLALLDDDDLYAVAAQWVTCEEILLDGPCPPEAVTGFLRDFAKLAQQAVEQQKSILLWTCL